MEDEMNLTIMDKEIEDENDRLLTLEEFEQVLEFDDALKLADYICPEDALLYEIVDRNVISSKFNTLPILLRYNEGNIMNVPIEELYNELQLTVGDLSYCNVLYRRKYAEEGEDQLHCMSYARILDEDFDVELYEMCQLF